MDSSYPKMIPKWTLPVQNGLFYSQNGLFWSLNGPKMDSSSPEMETSSPKMDSSVSKKDSSISKMKSSSPKMDSSGPKIVPHPFLSSLKVVFQMCLEILLCSYYFTFRLWENWYELWVENFLRFTRGTKIGFEKPILKFRAPAGHEKSQRLWEANFLSRVNLRKLFMNISYQFEHILKVKY